MDHMHKSAAGLAIADGLTLPRDVVTQKLACLGRTGSGKSYCAGKLAELMLEAGGQIIALDPVGVWWGLRVPAPERTDGKGFPVPVFGGLHGDVPLEPGAGALVADLVVTRGMSAVLDVSQFLSAEQTRFAADFATQFFQRKKASPSPVHLFLEEAQEFVPQNVGRDETRKVHAFERLIKLGRNFGIGATLLSQRPQEVNKKALNQTECLFAFQMTGPQERKAIETWVAEKGVNEDIATVLPHLRVGEPHVWSPQWLKISRTVRINPKRSADVSSTPTFKAKGSSASPHELLPVDLEGLRAEMAGAVERAKAEDPHELRRQINALQKEVAGLKRAAAVTFVAAVTPERPLQSIAVPDDRRFKELARFLVDLQGLTQGLGVTVHALKPLLGGLIEQVTAERLPARKPLLTTSLPAAPQPKVLRLPPPAGAMKLPKAALAALVVLAAHQPRARTKAQVALQAGYAVRGGSFGNALSLLRTRGLITGRDPLEITEVGQATAGEVRPMPIGPALVEFWSGQLPKAEATILRVLTSDGSRQPWTRETVATHAGYQSTGGSFGNALSRLRTLGLIAGSREITASEELF